MNRQHGSWLTLLLLVLFGGMVAVASQYPNGARLMPMAIGLAGLTLCLLQLALDLGAMRRTRAMNRLSLAPKLGRPEGHDESATGLGPQTQRKEFAMWVYFMAFTGGVLALGFYVAVPAMIFLYLWREAGTRPLAAAFAATAAGTTMVLVLDKLFSLELFPGLVWSAMLRPMFGS